MQYKTPFTLILLSSALLSMALLSATLLIQPLQAQQESNQKKIDENAATKDWTKVRNISKFGGFVMGNPDAETRISEYISYTCSHCANFEINSAPKIKNEHVKKGNVSFEIRNLIRDPLDLTIAILARCGGKEKFFENHNIFMREQANILRAASFLRPDDIQAWNSNSISDYARDAMNSLKLDKYLLNNGFTPRQIEQCITHQTSQKYISQMATHATLIQRVNGTPGFVINDEYQPSIVNLETLAPYL